MRGPISLLLAAASTALAQTVYMAGDSTMAPNGDGVGTGTDGWGQYLSTYLTIPVVNDAIAGRSARSYTREGRFTAINAVLKSGDFVIIEFGHNDGGSLTPTDNGRSDCPVVGNNYATTCSTVYEDVAETVLTYPAYLENAAKLFQAKGATVILSSPTIDNPWETGTFVWSPDRFEGYAPAAATVEGADFVDHEIYCAATYEKMTAAAVDALFPIDHTHTSVAGAKIVAKAFVEALEATDSKLNNYLA